MSSVTSSTATAAASLEARMDSALEIMVQDANGSDMFNNTKALVGFLEADKFLVLPKVFFEACATATDLAVDLAVLGSKDGIANYYAEEADDYRKTNTLYTDVVGLKTPVERKLMCAKIAVMNYIALKTAKVDEVSAIYAAHLRGHWSVTGGVLALSHDKVAIKDEYILVDETTPVYGKFVAAKTTGELLAALGNDATKFVEVSTDQNFGVKWVVTYAHNIWCAVEHAFRVRSHHFKNTGAEAKSYEEFYRKYLKSCYSGESIWPTGLDEFTIFHTAIHPFRIKALPKVGAHYVAHDLVATSAILRFNGAPCGNAVITTTNAALSTMASEAWFAAFSTAYSEQVDNLAAATKEILTDKYSYHVAAHLYGMKHKKTIVVNNVAKPVEEVKAKTEMLAAASHGLIMALKLATEMRLISSFALSNAKALEKPAAANPLLALKINQIVTASIDDISKADSSVAAIAALLPKFA